MFRVKADAVFRLENTDLVFNFHKVGGFSRDIKKKKQQRLRYPNF